MDSDKLLTRSSVLFPGQMVGIFIFREVLLPTDNGLPLFLQLKGRELFFGIIISTGKNGVIEVRKNNATLGKVKLWTALDDRRWEEIRIFSLTINGSLSEMPTGRKLLLISDNKQLAGIVTSHKCIRMLETQEEVDIKKFREKNPNVRILQMDFFPEAIP